MQAFGGAREGVGHAHSFAFLTYCGNRMPSQAAKTAAKAAKRTARALLVGDDDDDDDDDSDEEEDDEDDDDDGCATGQKHARAAYDHQVGHGISQCLGITGLVHGSVADTSRARSTTRPWARASSALCGAATKHSSYPSWSHTSSSTPRRSSRRSSTTTGASGTRSSRPVSRSARSASRRGGQRESGGQRERRERKRRREFFFAHVYGACPGLSLGQRRLCLSAQSFAKHDGTQPSCHSCSGFSLYRLCCQIRKLKVEAALGAQELGLELSTVAYACVYFERLCLQKGARESARQTGALKEAAIANRLRFVRFSPPPFPSMHAFLPQ